MKYLILAVAGVLVLGAMPWILARLGRRYGTNHVPIRTPRYVYLGFDPSLRERTLIRRAAADAQRARAAHIDSGSRAATVLRRIS